MDDATRLAVPTVAQAAWQDLEIGMFIHFAPNTWQGLESDNLSTPLDQINPRQLDVGQWVDVAEAMGARYIVFVAKHAGGFCLWNTATTGYSITHTPWRAGRGDVCEDLARECARRAMPLGFYLSPRDDHFGVTTGGRARSGNPAHQAFYDEIYTRQLTELCTRYGRLVELWFDGSTNGDLVAPIISKYQPQAMVFQSSAATIRWIGNEKGIAPYPTWNTVEAGSYEWTPSIDSSESGPVLASGQGGRWLPAEVDAPIRDHYWFWSGANGSTLRSLEDLMNIYYCSVGRGCNLLLNETPDTSGLIPEADAARTAEFGAEIRRRFAQPLATASGDGALLEITYDAAREVNHAVIMEDISRGERIEEYAIERWRGGQWQTVAAGSAVGHKRIERFTAAQSEAFRLKVTRARQTPAIRAFSLYRG